MAESLNMNEILAQVKRLDKKEQLTLLQRLLLLVKKSESKSNGSLLLTKLSGLGSEIWKSTNDIDHYLHEERQW